MSGLTGPTLDHLALASVNAWDNVVRYCYHLGARWLGGLDEQEQTGEFYFSQVEFEGGTKLEFLQPVPGPGSDFLRRFLDRNGPGPHHLTFKVPDIKAAIDEVTAGGYDVVNARFDNPDWQEAFLHPKQSHGIVIQLAQPSGDTPWNTPPPLPPGLSNGPATLAAIHHLVADLGSATKLFTGPLAMSIIDEGADEIGAYTTMGQGPWRLRLTAPVNDRHQHWLGDRPGRLLRLDMAVDDPVLIPDLRMTDDGWEIPPDLNQGTRVRITLR